MVMIPAAMMPVVVPMAMAVDIDPWTECVRSRHPGCGQAADREYPGHQDRENNGLKCHLRSISLRFSSIIAEPWPWLNCVKHQRKKFIEGIGGMYGESLTIPEEVHCVRIAGMCVRMIGALILCLLIAAIAGCGGSSGSTTPSADGFVAGTYSGTFTDGSNVFGHGTAAATIQYTVAPVGPSSPTAPASQWSGSGTITFVGNVVVAVTVNIELEPSSLDFQISLPNANNPSVAGAMVVSGTNAYSGSGLEYLYQTVNGTTQPVQQPVAAAITATLQPTATLRVNSVK
jgi:hypothetical protein